MYHIGEINVLETMNETKSTVNYWKEIEKKIYRLIPKGRMLLKALNKLE